MSSMAMAATDAATLLRRNLRRMQRYPSLTIALVALPLVLLVVFVVVFGTTMATGLSGAGSGRGAYLAYLVPGILLVAIGGAAQGTAITVAMDMTQGIIDRFRTMAIGRAAVLTAQVLASMIQMAICLAVVLGLAVALGFRPTAGPLDWIATIGVLAMITVAVTWIAVALGLGAKSVETASNSPMILTLLPFVGSGFVPTHSLPTGLQWFAEYQPFTPMIETVRGLLTGTPIGHNALLAFAWCIVLSLAGYLRSRSLFDDGPAGPRRTTTARS